jgi:hypothetical protein
MFLSDMCRLLGAVVPLGEVHYEYYTSLWVTDLNLTLVRAPNQRIQIRSRLRWDPEVSGHNP